MAEPVVAIPFSSTPFGRAIKTLGAGLLGFVATNYAPVISTLPHSELLMLIIAGLSSGIGRVAKEKGYDLKVV